MAITKVWIEEGCIVCNACEAECPDVFLVTDTTCVIKPDVRVDGLETENRDEIEIAMESLPLSRPRCTNAHHDGDPPLPIWPAPVIGPPTMLVQAEVRCPRKLVQK